jgi:DNA topoisomerase-3
MRLENPTLLLRRFLTRFKDKVAIATNIKTQARGAKALFIWTDCDREGEYIGSEVRTEALKGNSNLSVKRARFSNIERA